MATSKLPPEVFFLDQNSARSLQAQIRETVVASILSNQALPGTEMPSSRRLSRHLGIARMTITLAYQELIAQGYLETQNRRAYLVADSEVVSQIGVANPNADNPNRADWGGFLSSALSTRHRIDKPIGWRSFPYPFVYGQMDSGLFNFSAWRDCARQAMGKRDFDDMAGDFAASDDPVLVNYIRTRILPRRGIAADIEEILVTVGAQNALWLAIELLTRKPLCAVCENPGYPDTLQALRWCGADVTTVDIDDNGLPAAGIPKGTGAVFVTPSHHAPTGATMSLERRLALLRKAQEENFVIIEDDYEFEMSFLAPPSPALKSFDENGRVLYVGSFSKALFPGLRLGYLVGPREVIAEARELRSMMLRHPPGHLQRTTAYFLAQGHYDILVRNQRKKFAERRTVMQDALVSTNIEIAGASQFGGSSLWLKGPNGLDASDLAKALSKNGVLIDPGAPFFDGIDAPVEYFRLGYSSIPAEKIPKGIELIAGQIAKFEHADTPASNTKKLRRT